MKPNRPVPGKTSTIEERINICGACGYIIKLGDMCSYDCDEDGAPRTSKNAFVAVWRVTREFLRDEPYGGRPIDTDAQTSSGVANAKEKP